MSLQCHKFAGYENEGAFDDVAYNVIFKVAAVGPLSYIYEYA